MVPHTTVRRSGRQHSAFLSVDVLAPCVNTAVERLLLIPNLGTGFRDQVNGLLFIPLHEYNVPGDQESPSRCILDTNSFRRNILSSVIIRITQSNTYKALKAPTHSRYLNTSLCNYNQPVIN